MTTPTTADAAVTYTARRLSDNWKLALDIAAAITDRGATFPEVSDPDAINTYIDERITAAQAPVVATQARNIADEWRATGNKPGLGAISGLLGALAGGGDAGKPGRDSLAGLLGGKDDTASGPAALSSMVTASLYAKALAAGPDAAPAEVWETLTTLAGK
jgi:hypothetical protein